ncbi:hypothetical protein FKB34_03815 [Glycocaulis profundi]|nr:hypothetical protein FKB34_03815 [Glycocaulis profundi]
MTGPFRRLPEALIGLGFVTGAAIAAAHGAGVLAPEWPATLIWMLPAISFAAGAAMLYARNDAAAGPPPAGP